MGLRHKLVIVVIVVIAFQVLTNHCMPRHTNHSKFPLRSTATNIKSSHSKRTKKQAICNNYVATNISKSIRFPNVEYPSDSGPEEYYRFLNEYPIPFKSNNSICNCSCQAQKCKMETKYKRKLIMAANAKSKPKVITSIKKYDPEPQPYCFRRSGFFPEVDYPLSTRDMWIPKYWSRLQDVKKNNDPGKATCSTQQTHVSNYDSGSENAALNALIKALNTKKVQTPPTSNTNVVLTPNETVNNLDGTDLNNTHPINNSKEKGPCDKIEDMSRTSNSQSPPKLLTTKEANKIHDGVDSTTKSTTAPSLSPSKNLIQTQSTIKPGTKRPNQKDSEMQIKSSHNSSTPIVKTSAESLAITTTTTSLSTNIFTPLDYYDSTHTIYFDTTGMTTAAPFEYITSPMSASDILTNDTVLSQPEHSYHDAFATTTAISTSTPIPILTSIPPSCLSSSPNVLNNCYDYLIVADICPNNLSETDLSNLAKDWVLNSNDSYITCQIPDDCDDWIIYVNKENFSDKTLTSGETSKVKHAEERNRSQEEPKNVQDAYNTTTAMPPTPETRNHVDNNTTQVVAENTNGAHNTMDQREYEYVDDTMTSCTEIPYDLVLDPESINGYSFINDSLLTGVV